MDNTYDYLFNGEGNDTTPPHDSSTPQQAQGDSQEAQQAMNKDNNNAGNTQADDNFSFESGYDYYHDEADVDYLIPNIVQEEALHIVYGASENGKSFLVLDIAASIACNDIHSWCGKSITHGKVIYFVGESPRGMKRRFHCWCDERHVQPENVQLTFCSTTFKLDDTKDKKHSVNKLIDSIKKNVGKPALLIFDTISMFFSGEENSNSDVNHFMGVCKTLIAELGCSVILIHHTGLNPDAKNRLRGASAFRADIDIEFQVDNSNGVISLIQKKNKEAEKEQPLLFNLTQHTLEGRFLRDGKPVTSCTVEFAEKLMQYREAMQEEKKKPKLTKAQQLAFDAFSEAAKLHGEIITDNTDTGHEFIRLEDSHWRDYFYASLPQNNEEDSKKDKERKRVKFYNIKKFLTLETHALTIQRVEGHEYYCLDLSGNTDAAYRLEIRTGIKNREKAQAENSTKADNDDAGGAGGMAETDATPGLFE